jgi:hypothetical protein
MSAQAQNLQLNYKFDELNTDGGNIAMSTTCRDSSGNGRDAMYHDGGGNWSIFGEQPSAFPTLGTAVMFNGGWPVIDMGEGQSSAANGFMDSLTGNFSVAMWVQTNAAETEDLSLVGINYDTDTGTTDWCFKLKGASRQMSLRVGASDYDATDAAPITDGSWSHVAFTLALNGTLKFYCNGVQVGAAVTGVPLPTGTAAAWWVGSWTADSYNNGTVYDDLRIYDVVLDASQMATLATGVGLPIDFLPNRPPYAVSSQATYSGPFARFDGSDTAAAPCGAMDASPFTKSFTLEAWVNPSLTGSSGSAIGNRQWSLRVDDNRIHVVSWGIKDYTAVLPASAVIAVGQWTHIAAVVDSNADVSYYINGVFTEQVLRGADGEPTAGNNTDPWTLGARNRLGVFSSNFTGSIRDARVWDTALTAGDISSRYNTILTGSEANLLHWFPCDEELGTTLNDHGSANNDATMLSGVTWALLATMSQMEAWTQDVDMHSVATVHLPGTDPDVINTLDPLGARVTALPSVGTLTQSDGVTAIAAVPATLTDSTVLYTPPASPTVGGTTALSYKAWDGDLASTNTAVVTLRFVDRRTSITGTAVDAPIRSTVGAGWSAGDTIVINSVGLSDLMLMNAPVITGADSAAFKVLSDTGGTILAPGSSRTITVAFQPGYGRTYNATLSVATDMPQMPTLSIPVVGIGNTAPVAGHWTAPFGKAISILSNNLGVRVGKAYDDPAYTAPYAELVDNFTVEAWVNPSAADTGVIASTRGGNYGQGWVVWLNSGGQITITFVDNDLGGVEIFSAFTIPLDTWSHIAVKKAGADVTLYLNGVPEAHPGEAPPSGIASTDMLMIGYNDDIYADGHSFIGMLDDVRIWNVVRTDTEISSSYSQELTGTETGLMGYWKFNEGTGTQAQNFGSEATPGVLGAVLTTSDAWPLHGFVEPIAPTPDNSPAWNMYSPGAGADPISDTANETTDKVIALEGFDIDGDPLTFRVLSLPANGKLYQYFGGGRGNEITTVPSEVLDPSGKVVLAPVNKAANYVAEFTYTVSDGLAMAASPATVTIAVTAPPTPLVVTPRTMIVAANTAKSFKTYLGATGDDPVFFKIMSLPSAGTLQFNGSSAVIVGQEFTPDDLLADKLVYQAPGAVGPQSFTFQAKDSDEPYGAVHTFDITVNEANSLPVLTNNGMNAERRKTTTIHPAQLTGSDPEDGANVTFTITALPTKGNLLFNGVPMLVNGTFTPADIAAGRVQYENVVVVIGLSTDSFNFTLTDQSIPAGSVAGTFTITIMLPPAKASGVWNLMQ